MIEFRKLIILSVLPVFLVSLFLFYIPALAQINPNLDRVKISLDKSLDRYDSVTDRTEKILDKVQLLINKAKAQGKNTTQADTLMKDSRKTLSNDQSKLDEIQKLKLTASTKANFIVIGDDFKLVKTDLVNVRKNIDQILKTLK